MAVYAALQESINTSCMPRTESFQQQWELAIHTPLPDSEDDSAEDSEEGGSAALGHVCRRGIWRHPIVRELVCGAHDPHSPLSALRAQARLLELLLRPWGVQAAARVNLSHAVETGDPVAVALVCRYHPRKLNICQQSQVGLLSPLQRAAIGGDAAVVQEMLGAGLDPNFTAADKHHQADRHPPLWHAVKLRHTTVAVMLLAARADPMSCQDLPMHDSLLELVQLLPESTRCRESLGDWNPWTLRHRGLASQPSKGALGFAARLLAGTHGNTALSTQGSDLTIDAMPMASPSR